MNDTWNWFLWCGNEIQVLPHVFLKKSALYPVTPEVTELNNRKYQKKTSCTSSQRTTMEQNSRKQKFLKKITVSNTSWKVLFFLIFYAKQRGLNVREKRWSKQPYLATSREDLREAKLRIFSCSACVCGVMDARGNFGEHEKMRKSSSRRSRGQLQLFECSPNFPSAL